MSEPAPEAIVLAGYARLPQSTGAGVMWRHLTLIAWVRTSDGQILDVDTTLATRIAEEFVQSVLVGRSLIADQENVIETIETSYFGNGRKAIIGAFRDMAERFQESQAPPA